MTEPIRISEGIHWVGALDTEIEVFDLIMLTESGTTYNSYLIQGNDKVALVDTVEDGFEDQLLDRISAIVDPGEIDIVVVNHAEPDHSGSLRKVLAAAPNATVYGSKRALAFVGQLLNEPFASQVINAKQPLDLGGRALRFIPSPFIHWPDTIMTYLEPDGVLFPCDLFGSHYCDYVMFDDLVKGDYMYQMDYYFEAIMGPFRGHVLKALDKIDALEIAAICPSHGPLLRTEPARYIGAYRGWATKDADAPRRAVVCHASAYGNTRRLAEALNDGLEESGVISQCIDLSATPIETAAYECWRADAVLVGSCTINGAPAPQALSLLAYCDPFRMKGKRFLAFGSYGWKAEAIAVLNANAERLKMTLVDLEVKVCFSPSDDDLVNARDAGRQLAEQL